MRSYKLGFFIFLLSGAVFGGSLGKETLKADVIAEVKEEVAGAQLEVDGNIPSWLSGTLVRNGPIKVTIDGKSNAHWFDGLAMLHAFSFEGGRVNYSNRFLRSDAYHTVFEEGSIDYGGFASDPKKSLFKRLLSLFSSHVAIRNANVNVAKIADQYVALTEIPLPVRFDPLTLDTLGVLHYQDKLPKDKCWESAHPHYDPVRKETLNYLIDFGRKSNYVLYRIEDNSSNRQVISKISVDQPSYMHSFAVTQNYVIFTEFPFVVDPLDLILKGRGFIKNFSWKLERGTCFLVVDRHSGDLVGRYTTKPFFSFHHANAFEEDGMIHVDMVTYRDASILTGDNLYEGVNSDYCPSRLERFSLSLESGEITARELLSRSNEFPRINEEFDGNRYTYLYTAGFNEEKDDFDALYKLNTTTGEFLSWSEEGCSPGEPVFVANPGSKEEDEGVILALVIDHLHDGSFLLVLDAKTFQEMGRARSPHLIPAGFHGQHFPF